MRVVQFVQVVVLLALVGYVVLLVLENPVTVTLPLPFGLDPTLPLGAVLAVAVLVGALYATLLFIPRLLMLRWRWRREVRRRGEAEARLRATLQAKLAGASRPTPALSGQDDEIPWTDITTDPTPTSEGRNENQVGA